MSSRTNSSYYEYATVDESPGADGYFTDEIGARVKSIAALRAFFSVRGTGSAIVTLQFRCPGDGAWTDYAGYNKNTRKTIEGVGAGVEWRGVVKQGDYVSGSIVFGFDW